MNGPVAPLLIPLVVATLFFLIVPGLGALGVRQRWRLFRDRMVETSLTPTITYSALHGQSPPRGISRFLGTLESIQDDRYAWLRGERLTLAADMSVSDLFLLPGAEAEPEETPPVRTTWKRIGSLPEGIRILVSGVLDTSGPHPVLRATAERPLFAVLYDGPESTLVRRSVWSGRQRNEYWNSVTAGALAGGTLALMVVTYLLLRQPALAGYGRLALALAATPVLPLLPPGVGFFYLYRLAWRRARRSRAHRDVLLLPLRYLAEQEPCSRHASGEPYCETVLPRSELKRATDLGAHVERAPAPVQRRVGGKLHLYGRPAPEGMAAPLDALAEFVAVVGDPRELASACNRRARAFEFSSLVVFVAGLLMNYLGLLLLLGLLL